MARFSASLLAACLNSFPVLVSLSLPLVLCSVNLICVASLTAKLAESVTKLLAVCMICSADAPFTARISDETQVEVIGGAESYVAGNFLFFFCFNFFFLNIFFLH